MEMRTQPIKPPIMVSFILDFVFHILHFVFCILYFVFCILDLFAFQDSNRDEFWKLEIGKILQNFTQMSEIFNLLHRFQWELL